MVFHPSPDSTYYVCLLTSYGIPWDNASNEAAKVERMLNCARQREGYLGNDYSQSVDSRIFITYWKTEVAMQYWKQTLEYGEWANMEHLHQSNPIIGTQSQSYHIHMLSHHGSVSAKQESAAAPVARRISPSRHQTPSSPLIPLDVLPPVYEPIATSGSTAAQLNTFGMCIYGTDVSDLFWTEHFARSCLTTSEEETPPPELPKAVPPYVPTGKNIFAGNIKDDDCSDLRKPKEEEEVEVESSIFQYVTEEETTTKKRKKRVREQDPFSALDEDERLQYKVVVLMAMHSRRGNSRTEFSCPPPESNVMMVGFFWEHFPECEKILEESAGEYFTACYHKLTAGEMRRLNDRILERVQAAIVQNRYEVHPEFDDRKLRERIRCYYKTLIANAKKRLSTLEKHRESDENQAYLQIFIRCARDPTLSLRRSVEMSSTNEAFKRRRMGKIEQLRHQVWEN